MENRSIIDVNYILEAETFTRYLVSSPLRDKERDTYVKAMNFFNFSLSDYDKEVLDRMLQDNKSIATLDAGLALIDPASIVRRKLFTMLAILEASPNYTSKFLPKEYGFSYYLKLVLVVVRAVIRAIIGVFLIKKIQRKCI